MYVMGFALPIIHITNRPVVEALLPDFHFVATGSVNLVRRPALDELDCLFERGITPGGDDELKMIGHDDKFV